MKLKEKMKIRIVFKTVKVNYFDSGSTCHHTKKDFGFYFPIPFCIGEFIIDFLQKIRTFLAKRRSERISREVAERDRKEKLNAGIS